jgi:hypothetical protein
MKTEQKLANVFKAIAEQESNMDNTASQVLAICKVAKAFSIEKFDPLIEAAYDAAGWNVRGGRPTNGSTRTAVPNTVRTYVTTIRRAIRANMKVARYDSFSALRTALVHRLNGGGNSDGDTAARLTLPEDVKNDFIGVSVQRSEEPNGALFHDLAWTFLHLPKDQRPLFGRQLAQLMRAWQAKVPAKASRVTARTSEKQAA